eukprot:scaffold11212_cov66-Skeletonema_marinoi.AAC.2
MLPLGVDLVWSGTLFGLGGGMRTPFWEFWPVAEFCERTTCRQKICKSSGEESRKFQYGFLRTWTATLKSFGSKN